MITAENKKVPHATSDKIATAILCLLLVIIGCVSFLMIWQSLQADTDLPAFVQNTNPVYISITDQGFVPDVVTVTLDSLIVWTNNTNQTVEIVSGVIPQVFLPVVLREGNDYSHNMELTDFRSSSLSANRLKVA